MPMPAKLTLPVSVALLCFAVAHSAAAQDADLAAAKDRQWPGAMADWGKRGTPPDAGIDPDEWTWDVSGLVVGGAPLGLNHRARDGAMTAHLPPVSPLVWYNSWYASDLVPGSIAQLSFNLRKRDVLVGVTWGSWRPIPSSQYDYRGQGPDATNYNAPRISLAVSNLLDGKARLLVVAPGLPPDRTYGASGRWGGSAFGYNFMLFGRFQGAGVFTSGEYDVSRDFTLRLDEGFGMNPPNVDERANAGFLQHAHLSLIHQGSTTFTLHHAIAWDADNQFSACPLGQTCVAAGDAPPASFVPPAPAKSGKVQTLGADVRIESPHWGLGYLGYSQVRADNAVHVPNSITVVNAVGPRGLIGNYFGGTNGTGVVHTIALQYELSLGALLYYPTPFPGNVPDVRLTVFGFQQFVKSEDPAWNDVKKRKLGIDATYSMLPHLSGSLRIDHIEPDTRDSAQNFWALTPRLTFHTDFVARESVILAYSHAFFGSHLPSAPRPDGPPQVLPSLLTAASSPYDRDIVSLSATLAF